MSLCCCNVRVVADLNAMGTGDGTYTDNTTTPATTLTLQQQRDNIAMAYNMEGSTDDFFNLVYEETTGTPPNTTTNKYTVQQLLDNIGGTGPNIGYNATTPVANSIINDTNDFTFTTSARNFTGVLVNYDAADGSFKGVNGSAKTVTLNLRGINSEGNFENVVIDMTQTSNVDNKGTCTIGATNGADDEYNTGSGRRVGEMIGISIQNDGKIYSTYDNGMTKLLGQIATARFANASGLEKQADNLYSATLNSGEFDGIGVDITAAGDGSMSTGQLEMSNVDLSSEFTEMITTQRGFQANSRIITVSDTLLEELTNLKR